MNNIKSSATKIVLLYIVGMLGLLVGFVVIWSVVTNTTSELTTSIVATFSGIVGVVVGHYFNKTASQQPPIDNNEQGK